MFHPKFVVPNAFTALSMLFGLASLLASAQGSFTLAAWMICWGVLLDKLDGTAARLLKASSSFGAELDSFADFVVFGIAPAALIYHRLSPLYEGDERLLLLLGAGAYVLANAARLARFNTTTPEGGDAVFYGIPTTFCGAFLATTYLVWEKYGLDEELLRGMVGLLFVAGIGMVSNLKLPKLKRRKSKLFNAFQALNVAGAYGFAALRMFPEYLWTLVIVYLTVGVAWGLRQTYAEAPPQEEPAEG